MFWKEKRIVNEPLLREIRKQECSVCGKPGGSEASHIRSRGSGGPDAEWNVFPKCRPCHMRWHRMSHQRYFDQYPHFLKTLIENGWIFKDDDLWHPALAHHYD